MSEPFLVSATIPNCYDSHVHWRATGEMKRRLNLRNLRSDEDALSVPVEPVHFRGDWLVGHGWDQNLFTSKNFPTRQVLDERFGDTPVCWTRVDGHAVWANTAALKRAGVWQKNLDAPPGGHVMIGDDGFPTGVLVDLAMPLVTQHLPEPTDADISSELIEGQKVFHRAGFTHIRDLTCDDKQWQVACDLEARGQLALAVEQFFSADDPRDFDARLRLALLAKKQRTRLLRPMGIKVYLDGALGSEGAWLSRPYNSGSGTGLVLLERATLKDMMRLCFENDVHIAIHTIGDEAAHQVSEIGLELSEFGIDGKVHLEHAELLRPETVLNLARLRATCHMQPCHWLSDKVWLEGKIGDLVQRAFQWGELSQQDVPVFFGSDTPIEATSLQRNIDAVIDAKKCGHSFPKEFNENWMRYHSHPDRAWPAETYTVFRAGRPERIVFGGMDLKP